MTYSVCRVKGPGVTMSHTSDYNESGMLQPNAQGGGGVE